MFRQTSTELHPRVSAIAGHLRAIERELGGIGRSASRRASTSASVAGSQIADAVWPISTTSYRFGRGQRAAADGAAGLGSEAVKIGARASNEALDRIATRTKNRPIAAIAVAIGVGLFDWCGNSPELTLLKLTI